MGTDIMASAIAEEQAAPSPPAEAIIESSSQVVDLAVSSEPTPEAEQLPAAPAVGPPSSKTILPLDKADKVSADKLQVAILHSLAYLTALDVFL